MSATSGEASQTSPVIKTPQFNYNALLNPKGAAAKRNMDEDNDLAPQSQGVDFGSMIESRHGVDNHAGQHRTKIAAPSAPSEDEPPAKKHKGSTFAAGNAEGPISEYVNKKREEGRAEAGPDGSVVDLTEDNDDITFIKSVAAPEDVREVCLGMLEVHINAHKIPSASRALESIKGSTWPATKVTLRRTLGANLTVEAHDKPGNHFGNLDPMSSNALVPLLNVASQNKFRHSTMLQVRPRAADEKPGQNTSKLFKANVTLFASSKFVEAIGRALSQKQMFLHNPIQNEGREVINPHVPKLYVRPTTIQNGFTASRITSTNTSSRTSEEIRSDVFAILDKMTNVEDLPEMEPDYSIINKELMSHQKQALWFLTEHEKSAAEADKPSTLWKTEYRGNGSKVFCNVISGDERKSLADTITMGGIFADMMGLGKTLSVLSRIVATIHEARQFGKSKSGKGANNKTKTGATLIICPKSVLSNWDEQITSHLKAKKVTFYSYHGPKREQDLSILAKYDIVITSYTTVATEYSFRGSRYKALGKLDWFRIVLDEAHMIRNQTTSTYLGTCELTSARRWAVTGTPVQNRLEDLGALIKFVKVAPFFEQGSFEQHFIAPFKHAKDSQVLHNLRLLVDSITLRRSKDKIDLPQRIETTMVLEFSDSERALYDCFAKDSDRKMRALLGTTGLRGKAYAHMLTFITRLRLLCAHGRELLSEEDLKTLEGNTMSSAIDLGDDDEDKPAISESDAYKTLYMLREGNICLCARCGEELEAEDNTPNEVADESDDDEAAKEPFGYLTPCYQLICPNCIDWYNAGLAKTTSGDNRGTCPACDQYIRAFTFPLTHEEESAEQRRREEKRRNPKARCASYSGPHTKVKALVSRLKEHAAASARLAPGEPPIRSVVFSGWTSYLDLIEIALDDNGIDYLRLDGKMSVPARTRVLERFRTEPEITVCLVSVKAGGQGLNFTAANNVYMMEPQFNPGVEMQAVDRVHRLGQTRDVEIVKFIMEGSFEENIVKLQKQKMDLAATALAEGKKMGKQEEAKQRMENLRSLFKR